MICALDIGNSAVKGGVFDAGELVESFREEPGADPTDTAGRVARRLMTYSPERVGVSSVVPRVSDAIDHLLQSAGVARLFRVSPTVRLPFVLSYETPGTLGVDRLAAAAGAYGRLQPVVRDETAFIVIDAGTATTIDVVDRGHMLGGPILPGPELLRRAARSGTAQLPEVDLVWPDRVVARTTVEALRAGVMFGFVDAVRGLLLRVMDELGRDATVVATGGWSELLADKISLIAARDPHLVIRGVALLMEMNSD